MKKPKIKVYGENSYSSIHHWLVHHYGHGLYCTRCGLKGKMAGRRWSLEYALKPNHSYKKDINHYDVLCKACHRKQDINEEILLNMRKGWILRRKERGLNPIDAKTGRFVKKHGITNG